MSVATVDITDESKLNHQNELNKLKSNTVISPDSGTLSNQSLNSNYYYSTGSFNFILDKGFKPETIEELSITSVPFLPKWNKGIVSIHGLIIPVIDINLFAQNQGLQITKPNTNKRYLLKLEHKDYKPIVLILDSLPRLINTDDFESMEAATNSPSWIKNNLHNNSIELAFIDHNELFEQIIKAQ